MIDNPDYMNELYIDSLAEKCEDHPTAGDFEEVEFYDLISKIIELAKDQDRMDDLFDYDYDYEEGSTVYVDDETFDYFLELALNEFNSDI